MKKEKKKKYLTHLIVSLSHLLVKERGRIELHIFFRLFIKWFLAYI